jgi:hypothetical protein
MNLQGVRGCAFAGFGLEGASVIEAAGHKTTSTSTSGSSDAAGPGSTSADRLGHPWSEAEWVVSHRGDWYPSLSVRPPRLASLGPH